MQVPQARPGTIEGDAGSMSIGLCMIGDRAGALRH
jgi:hypothetical protein